MELIIVSKKDIPITNWAKYFRAKIKCLNGDKGIMIIFRPQEKPDGALKAWTEICRELNYAAFSSSIKHGVGRTVWLWYEKAGENS